MKLFRDKRVRYRNLVLIILPFIIIAGVCGFVAIRSTGKIIDNTAGVATNDKKVIDSMDYHLRSNATQLQTQLFDELSDALNSGDSFNIAKLIAENFVADFYTWTNKSGSYDVGGMYYVYPHSKINIYQQARDQYYKYVTYYINTYGADKLLEVDSITAEVGNEVGKYDYNGKSYDSYFVTCDWTYKDDTSLDKNDYVTHEYFNVIFDNEDNRYEIVQAYGDDNE